MVLTSTGATSWPYVASRTCSTVGVKSRICGKHSKIETPPGIWALCETRLAGSDWPPQECQSQCLSSALMLLDSQSPACAQSGPESRNCTPVPDCSTLLCAHQCLYHSHFTRLSSSIASLCTFSSSHFSFVPHPCLLLDPPHRM